LNICKKQDDGVVITGIGAVSPLANDFYTTWDRLLAGVSGVQSYVVPPELASYEPRWARVAALVKNIDEKLTSIVPPATLRKTDRFVHFALIAGHEAMTDAGISVTAENTHRFGTYVGVGIGGLSTVCDGMVQFLKEGEKTVSPFLIPRTISNEAASWLSMQWNLQGPSLALVNACSSSADAIGLSYRMIKNGYVDAMLTGGTEATVVPLAMAAFGNMRALSQWKGNPGQASRPFDAQRTGFVMGEGAAMLVLEKKSLALQRGARIYAEIVGYSATSDAYHVTAMQPEGKGAEAAIRLALEEAHGNLTDIGYINAHGTGTPMNDAIETLVIKKVFGDHAAIHKKNHLLVSSTKSMTGHLLGGAGALEIAFTAQALKSQKVPATINLEFDDPNCDLDYVKNVARDHSFTHALSNSFGFGGANAVVVLKRFS